MDDILRTIMFFVFVGMFAIPILYCVFLDLTGKIPPESEIDGSTIASLREPRKLGPHEKHCNGIRK